jgi:hypothetical protein
MLFTHGSCDLQKQAAAGQNALMPNGGMSDIKFFWKNGKTSLTF